MAAPHPLLSDPDWLLPRWEAGATAQEIADEADAEISTVYLWLRRHEAPLRRHDVDAEVRRLHGRGMAPPEIADRLGVDSAVVHDRLYRMGLATVDLVADAATLRRWYDLEGWSTYRVAQQLGISRRAATRQLLAAGVTLRGRGRPFDA